MDRELEREIGWSHLGWIQHENCRKRLRRQNLITACKWIMVAAGLFIIAVVIAIAIGPQP